MNTRPIFRCTAVVICCLSLSRGSTARAADAPAGGLRAGAAAVDITPTRFPVLVNGGFQPVVANQASDKLHARCLVLDDGKTKLAICVVDSCLMPRDLLDEAKRLASASTGIPADKMLVSATHTHSAPAVMGALGTDVDPHYPPVLKAGVVKAIEQAHRNLEPAKVAWGVSDAAGYTATRRWIRRPDRMLRDPFGELTVRANMHPGYLSADAIGPSGPEDPDLTVLSVRRADGSPLALLGNFAMHYFASGVKPVSSDYFGLFAQKVAARLGVNEDDSRPPFVGIMSQGTSGDAWRMDYSRPQKEQQITIDQYADDLARLAALAVAKAEYRGDVTLAMAQKEIKVKARGPDAKRLEWAKKVLAEMGDRPPKTQPEVYAREQVFLSQRPEADLLLQAIRVGDLGITALPNEVFALTGLKIKAQSPLRPTMNVELANDELGYIPPPEQHKLGGYTTWPARSSYPDVDAEPRMVEAVLELLEEVSGKPRRPMTEPQGQYARAVLAAKPLALWRMGDAAGGRAVDGSGNDRHGAYEEGVVFYLEGPASAAFSGEGVVNRAAHFAGGRMKAELPDLGPTYSVEMWFWNGLPGEARPVAGYLFSRGQDGDKGAAGDHLGIGGTHVAADRLIYFNGNEANAVLSGETRIEPRTWNHVVLVRDGKNVRAYLNGNPKPEIDGEAEVTVPEGTKQIFIGGRCDNFANFEGKIDEVAVYGRALGGDEAGQHFKAAAVTPPPAKAPGAILQPPPPKTPAESLKALHVKDGYEVELVAAEPLVLDPVAMAWGPDGKLWVVEMADYPYGADGKMRPAGRVRFLEDTNGDGKYDRGTLFMEDLNFPTGVMPWRKGVLVSAAPDILYAEDTDGDGKADKKEVLYTGFTQGNPQLRMNGFAWGFDNWVHVANGMSSQGKVRSTRTGQAVSVSNRDLRIRPDDGSMETETGVSQFGRRQDDWGEWLGVHNSHPVRHFVIPERYARRNPHVTLPAGFDHATLPTNPRLYARSRIQKRYGTEFYQQSNVFTSACGIAPYRDELLFGGPPVYEGPGHVFVCDPVHNLVQHLLLTPNPAGPTFTASRAAGEEFAEFLASEDQWFRPVFLASGPDGALWVADMYRYMIEHPDWLPPEGKEDYRPFYRLGTDKGRIYRVFPNGRKPRPVPRLDGLDTGGLVAALEAPGGWQRDMAHMMLLWRDDPAAVAPLEHLAGKGGDARARLHALATLGGLKKLKPETVERALRDEHPAVRRHAVRLAEGLAAKAPALTAAAARLAADPDPRVRLQLAFTLGEWDGPEAGAALAGIALAAGDEAYLAAAVMSSATKHYRAVADALLQAGRAGGAVGRDLLAMSLAVGDRDLTARLLGSLLAPRGGQHATMQFEQFAQFLDHLAQHRTSVWKLMEAARDPLSDRLRQAEGLFDAARSAAADPDRPAAERAAAVALLAREERRLDEDVRRLAALVAGTGRTPAHVQAAAVRALGRVERPEVPPLLTARWNELTPPVRAGVLDVLLAHEPGAWHLLKAVESKQVPAGDLDVPRRQRLINHSSRRVKALARELLGDAADASAVGRRRAVEAYASVLSATGDAKRGEKVFLQHCATCHRVGGVGQEVGPNLESVRGWPADALLTSILDPNRAAEPRYLAFTATTSEGETIEGVVTAETAAAVTMKSLDGKERVIPRSNLKTLVNTTRSFMPDGLEAAIPPEQMGDLIRYLQTPPQ